MKNFNLWMLSFILLFFTSCGSHLITVNNEKQIDKRLVGTWGGSEKDEQMEGLEKQWEMQRKADGTFVLDFSYKLDGNANNGIEKGNWWVENGKFYEFHEYSGQTDVYQYEVLDKNRIKFSAEKISVDMATENYTFIDTRKKTNVQEGSSFDTAIKVNSVSEEYSYIEANCTDCKFRSQSLAEHKGKMFDVIQVEKADGSTSVYYFDINSFFGKF
ncbi:lipocalin family protein [Myroides sp. C15-4]|uniref:lipocalin family protein n=1 Tax=Myroides sp. C15-4 TaxID=3400532 RepID=UPI003D2F88BD